MTTFAQALINSGIPEDYQFNKSADKKVVYNMLTNLAKEKPDQYSDVVKHVKQAGDFFSTTEGITVGLDDITPNYAARNELMSRTRKDLGKLQTYEGRQKRILKAQEEGIALAKQHKGSLTKMAISGGRGSYGQLIKSLVAPVTVKGPDDKPTDFLMAHSYSEGIDTDEFWMGAGEARREAAKGNLATALPGDSSKQLINTLNKVTVSMPDCGTTNGILLRVTDSNIYGRYTAGTNILIDQQYQAELSRGTKKYIKVRSPLTCEAQPGVCQKCYGTNSMNKLIDIGTNQGIRVAQALSEPLTQMILSSKHGGNMAKIEDGLPAGMEGFKQLMDIPKIFKNEATLSTSEGRITNVEKLPHGGHNLMLNGDKHFVHPGKKLLVQKGDYVGKGDKLSEGVEHPGKVTDLRGLGSGRKYLADTLYSVYSDSGVDIDKRNLELLAREDLNYVKVTKSDPNGEFLKHDIVPYNKVMPIITKTAKPETFSKNIIGKTLGENYLHFTAGTEITPSIYNEMAVDDPSKVSVTSDAPAYKPFMTALERVPNQSGDVIATLAHRRIKDAIIDGASKSKESWFNLSPITDTIFSYFK